MHALIKYLLIKCHPEFLFVKTESHAFKIEHSIEIVHLCMQCIICSINRKHLVSIWCYRTLKLIQGLKRPAAHHVVLDFMV